MEERVSVENFLQGEMDKSHRALEKMCFEKCFWCLQEVQISWLSETGRIK
jgi:hypothetical protein